MRHELDLPSLAHPEDEAEGRTPIAGPPARAGRPRARRPFLLALAGCRAGELFAVPPLRAPGPPRDEAGGLLIGRDGRRVWLHLPDAQVSRRHAALERSGEHTLRLRDLGSTNGTYVRGERVGVRTLLPGDRVALGGGNLLQVLWLDALEERFHRELIAAALRDPLTRAYNRRYLRQRLHTELAFAGRHGTTVALLLIDVDHFKRVNDQHGHAAGDAVLRKLAQVLGAALRSEDVLARWGGEEFIVLLRSTADEPALALGERVRARVAATPFPHGRPVHVSIGVAVYPGGPPWPPGASAEELADHLLEHADQALYLAKRRGRNQVATSTEAWLADSTARARALIVQGGTAIAPPPPPAKPDEPPLAR